AAQVREAVGLARHPQSASIDGQAVHLVADTGKYVDRGRPGHAAIEETRVRAERALRQSLHEVAIAGPHVAVGRDRQAADVAAPAAVLGAGGIAPIHVGAGNEVLMLFECETAAITVEAVERLEAVPAADVRGPV